MTRVLYLTTYSPTYLAACVTTLGRHGRRDFAWQQANLFRDSYGWADFWTRPLAQHGFELFYAIANVQPLQHAWAREHGMSVDDERWPLQIALAQAADYRPEIVFVDEYRTFDATFLRELRARCPTIRAIVGHCGAPHRGYDAFACYDLVLSNIKAFVDEFRAQGLRAEHLPHAFSTLVPQRMAPAHAARIPFSFVGSLLPQADHHVDRIATLQQMVLATPILLFAPGAGIGSRDRLTLAAKRALWPLAHRLVALPIGRRLLARMPALDRLAASATAPARWRGLDPVLARRLRPPRYGLAMFDLLAHSDLTFNQHIDVARGNASNMRLFEATGVGSCLLTDALPDLAELFEPDREVATYGSPAEAVDKAQYLLTHDAKRREIAAAGQRRALRDHTFEQRAPLLAQHLRSALG